MLLKECLHYANSFVKEFENNPEQFQIEKTSKIKSLSFNRYKVLNYKYNIILIKRIKSADICFYFENYNYFYNESEKIFDITNKKTTFITSDINGKILNDFHNITNINDITEEVEFYLKLKGWI